MGIYDNLRFFPQAAANVKASETAPGQAFVDALKASQEAQGKPYVVSPGQMASPGYVTPQRVTETPRAGTEGLSEKVKHIIPYESSQATQPSSSGATSAPTAAPGSASPGFTDTFRKAHSVDRNPSLRSSLISTLPALGMAGFNSFGSGGGGGLEEGAEYTGFGDMAGRNVEVASDMNSGTAATESSGGSIMGPIVGTLGMVNMLRAPSYENREGYVSNITKGAANGAAIGSYWGPVGTGLGAIAGGVVGGLKTVFGSKSATEMEDERWGNLVKGGIDPFGYGGKPNFGNKGSDRLYQEMKSRGVSDDFIGEITLPARTYTVAGRQVTEPERKVQVNMPFLRTADEKYLTPADAEKYAVWFEAFGKDWWTVLTPEDRAAIITSAVKNDVLREHHGTLDVESDRDGFAQFEKDTKAVLDARAKAMSSGGSGGGFRIPSISMPTVKAPPPAPPDLSSAFNLSSMAQNIRANDPGAKFTALAEQLTGGNKSGSA